MQDCVAKSLQLVDSTEAISVTHQLLRVRVRSNASRARGERGASDEPRSIASVPFDEQWREAPRPQAAPGDLPICVNLCASVVEKITPFISS